MFISFLARGTTIKRRGGDPDDCDPNSIWLHKSYAHLMTVGTCDLDENMWYYSSRGPGQFFGEPDTNRKPDVIAPTPRDGLVVYGDELRTLEDGWGTSGACPQVAGLAALLLSVNGNLSPETIREIIRSSARDIGLSPHCQGDGIIDCYAALKQL